MSLALSRSPREGRVEYVDILFVGILMFSGGLYARRRGRLRHRAGAAVLAGVAALVGLLAMGAGFVGILKG
jgi:uncharacterized membrane protein YgdD (TMEM256/DUF423 family)